MQLGYESSVVLLRCLLVPEIPVMHGGLPPPVRLERCLVTFKKNVIVR